MVQSFANNGFVKLPSHLHLHEKGPVGQSASFNFVVYLYCEL